MNKLMLASFTAILAGAMTLPAIADDTVRRAGGESSWQGGSKGPHRVDGDRSPGNSEHARPAPRTVVQPQPAQAQIALRNPARAAYEAQLQSRGREWNRDGDRDGDRDHGGDRDWGGDRDRGDRDWGDRDRDGRDWGDRDRDDRNWGGHDGDRGSSHGRDWRNEWREDRHDWRSDQRRDCRYYTRYRDSRWSGFNWSIQYRYRAPTRYIYPTGYHPYRWSVGYRMPYSYYSPRQYWVDYRAYRLPPPPYGYTWVRVDRDVVLVELASGLIRDVLFGLFY